MLLAIVILLDILSTNKVPDMHSNLQTSAAAAGVSEATDELGLVGDA